jgi:short-subunit dehydrogenase
VNNAGIGLTGALLDTDPDAAEHALTVDLIAPVLLTRALLPGMRERGRGRVVNVASIAGHVGVPEEAVYAAAKAGLVIFSESLRQELRGTGVGVTVISPGAVRTAFHEREGRPYDRRFPTLLSADRVARVTVDALAHDRERVFVPRWMAFPAWLHGAAPRLYERLAERYGSR